MSIFINFSFMYLFKLNPFFISFSECVGKKVLKGKDRNKVDKLRPSDDELRTAICEILKEVDFNTVRNKLFLSSGVHRSAIL